MCPCIVVGKSGHNVVIPIVLQKSGLYFANYFQVLAAILIVISVDSNNEETTSLTSLGNKDLRHPVAQVHLGTTLPEKVINVDLYEICGIAELALKVVRMAYISRIF